MVSLGYPNAEVRESMALRMLESEFHDINEPGVVCVRVRNAILNRDPTALVCELNMLLARIPYEDFGKEPHDEYFYRSYILTLVYAAGLEPYGEIHCNVGRSDIFMSLGDQIWILELKVSHNSVKSDEKLAEKALKQIKEKNYSVTYFNPVILGLVVNDEARLITTWRCQGGLLTEPVAKAEPNPNDIDKDEIS
jgi:hypothetical protein